VEHLSAGAGDATGGVDPAELDARMDALRAHLAEIGSLLVAFSGGADSALLLAVSARTLGPEHVVAATAVSPSLPSAELSDARAFAAAQGVRHLTPGTDELSRPGYVANGGDRCYFCKSELVDVLLPLADAHGLAAVATGTNADDAVAGFRPGIRAAAERGAVTPLLDAGLTKAQVRAASRAMGLPTWDKPAAACLSSRVAYGVPVTAERLARVERAETALRRALAEAAVPVRDVRVRDLGDRARVEVDAALVERVAGLESATAAVLAAGFTVAEVDPRGFRSGSMNEVLVPLSEVRPGARDGAVR
jgi:pyridinium-3,5-biscarboxylic acid mononucleotide sulfurtransferase